jgi:hypothetical protein
VNTSANLGWNTGGWPACLSRPTLFPILIEMGEVVWVVCSATEYSAEAEAINSGPIHPRVERERPGDPRVPPTRGTDGVERGDHLDAQRRVTIRAIRRKPPHATTEEIL